jgi:plasmid maintenance system antidote protein VapI
VNLTVRDVARVLGVPEKQINAWIAGRRFRPSG